MRHDYGEQRFVAFGWIRNRLHVCVYTLRKGSYRIISLRKANRREISGYCTKVLQGGEAVDQKTDWERVDAMTDEDIARQIAADPDVAPDMSEALERGEFIRLHVFNVFALRTRLGPTHEAFAARFGLDPDEVRRWEAMGGVPAEAIRTYFRVIDREPEAVARAVAAARAEERQSANAD